jgi:hypothetical protein
MVVAFAFGDVDGAHAFNAPPRDGNSAWVCKAKNPAQQNRLLYHPWWGVANTTSTSTVVTCPMGMALAGNAFATFAGFKEVTARVSCTFAVTDAHGWERVTAVAKSHAALGNFDVAWEIQTPGNPSFVFADCTLPGAQSGVYAWLANVYLSQ